MRELPIEEGAAGQRLDKFLAKYLNTAPKSFLYKMLRKKNITLNGKRAEGDERLAEGDVVRLFLAEETIAGFQKTAAVQKTKTRPDILYEDAQILLINKPCGVLSQKAEKSDVSLVEELLSYLHEKGEITEETLRIFRPTVCNRLDRNTSGIVAAAKTLPAAQYLSGVFRDRSVHKYYHCLVKGTLCEKTHISGWLTKNARTNRVRVEKEKTSPDAVPIETSYRPLAVSGDLTLLEVCLLTGRSHQIRAHLASIGHPIVGDPKYGDSPLNRAFKKEFGLEHQLLHSFRLEFPPSEGEFAYLGGRVFCAGEPALFLRILKEKGLAVRPKEGQ